MAGKKRFWLIASLFLAVAAFLVASMLFQVPFSKKTPVRQPTSSSQLVSSKKSAPAKIDWQAASQRQAYPLFSQYPAAWIQVSLKAQRVYIKSQTGRTLYTMYCSSGLGHTTPTGTFYIQAERGRSFFNGTLQEGANYWVSFKDHGVYLFHSVPTQADGRYNIAEAQKLGHPASHGCIRLTVADAKWFYENVPFNTKVIIGD